MRSAMYHELSRTQPKCGKEGLFQSPQNITMVTVEKIQNTRPVTVIMLTGMVTKTLLGSLQLYCRHKPHTTSYTASS